MAEKIYAIPVNDAFDKVCECPVCIMYRDLEADAISFTMGPSYMDDRFRLQTDEKGFCKNHMQMLYDRNNRLGLALIMKTHMEKTNRDIEALSKSPFKSGLFGKSESPVAAYVKKLNEKCFVCERVKDMYDRYIYTILYLYRTSEEFREKYAKCQGFCTEHFGRLITDASSEMSGKTLKDFVSVTTNLYLENMKRVHDDLEWFVKKYDYNYKDEPWKNAKDSIIRGMTKTNGIVPLEEKRIKEYD